jgi:hypothetical protein
MPQTGNTMLTAGASGAVSNRCGRGRQVRIATAALARWMPSAKRMKSAKATIATFIRSNLPSGDDMPMTHVKVFA